MSAPVYRRTASRWPSRVTTAATTKTSADPIECNRSSQSTTDPFHTSTSALKSAPIPFSHFFFFFKFKNNRILFPPVGAYKQIWPLLLLKCCWGEGGGGVAIKAYHIIVTLFVPQWADNGPWPCYVSHLSRSCQISVFMLPFLCRTPRLLLLWLLKGVKRGERAFKSVPDVLVFFFFFFFK